MTVTHAESSHVAADDVPSDQEEIVMARRMELERRIERYFDNSNSYSFGRSFTVKPDGQDSRKAAVAWLADVIRDVEAIDLEERIGEPDPV